jgi:hypothetical protein
MCVEFTLVTDCGTGKDVCKRSLSDAPLCEAGIYRRVRLKKSSLCVTREVAAGIRGEIDYFRIEKFEELFK